MSSSAAGRPSPSGAQPEKHVSRFTSPKNCTSVGVFSVVTELADVGSSMMKEDILEESVEDDDEFGDRDCPDFETALGVDIRLLFL